MRSKRIKPELVAEEVIRKGEDQDGFVIEIIPPKGCGVRTTLLRCKGDFLLAYDGELVSGTEDDRREQKKDSTFHYFFIYMGKELCVDSTKEVDSGLQLGRLVNHGCGKEENCKMKCIEVDKKPCLCLFAIRDIEPGEELLYNYGVSNLPWENVNIKDAATSESVTTPDPGNITSNPVSMETTSKLSAASSLLSSTSRQDTQTQQNAILRPKIFKYRETSKQPGSTGQVGQISEAVFKSGADETVSKLQDFDCTRQTKPDQSQTPNVSGGQPTLLHDAATSESVTTPDPGNITSNPVSMETTSKLSASSSLLLSTSLQDTQTQQNAILRPKIFKYRETSKQPGSTGQVGQISEAVFKSGADETVSKLQDFDCTRQTKPDQSQTPNVSGGQPTLLHGRVSFQEER